VWENAGFLTKQQFLRPLIVTRLNQWMPVKEDRARQANEVSKYTSAALRRRARPLVIRLISS